MNVSLRIRVGRPEAKNSSVFLRGSCALALLVGCRQNMLRQSSGVEKDSTNLTDASGFAASTADHQSHVACDDDHISIGLKCALFSTDAPELAGHHA